MIDNSISIFLSLIVRSYMDICNSLNNNMKNDEQISNIIAGLLLEFKQIIHSKDEKRLILDNLSKRVDDYKNLFTFLKIIYRI